MAFYIVRALFPALPLDIWLTIILRRKRRKIVSAFATPPLYIICAFIWNIILSATNPAFRGQGALGLMLLMAIAIAFSLLRIVCGLLLMALDR